MKAAALWSFLVDLRPRQIERWARIRSRGRLRFVIVEGVLLYGGMLAILGSALIYTLYRTDYETIRFSWAPQPVPDLVTGVILPTVAVALAIGVVEGFAMWWLMEWLYRRHLSRPQSRHA